MWGVSIRAPIPAAPPPAATPAPPSIFVDAGLSDEGALDLPLDDTPLELEPASSPTFNSGGIRASGSAQLDISEMPEESIRTSSLADLAQGGSQPAPVGEIEIDSDGSPGDETELASAHEFLPAAPKGAPPAYGAKAASAPKPAAVPHDAPTSPQASDGGEGALRMALSQASREVIEKIAWEVVPQLAEVIIREHVERLVRERSPK
jgi:hypothetical protein